MSFLLMSFVKLHYKFVNDIGNKKFLFALRFASFSHISLRTDWIMRPCWLKEALKMFYLQLLLKAHLLKSLYQFEFFFGKFPLLYLPLDPFPIVSMLKLQSCARDFRKINEITRFQKVSR